MRACPHGGGARGEARRTARSEAGAGLHGHLERPTGAARGAASRGQHSRHDRRRDPGIPPPASPPRTSWPSCSAGTCARTGVARTARTTTASSSRRVTSPLLYAMLKAGGAISDEELLSLRELGVASKIAPPLARRQWRSRRAPARAAPAAVGVALGARLLGHDIRCWVLLGDSEMAEGGVYEALELGGHYGLAQLVAIVDMNRLGQRGPTMLEWDGEQYAERAGVRLEGARHRRPPARRHRPRVRAGGTVRSPDVHRRAHEEGRGRVVPRGQGGLARQGALEGRGGAGARGARQPSLRSRRGPAGPAPDEAAPRAASLASVSRACATSGRGRDARGVRDALGRWAPRAGTSSRSTGRSATRRTRARFAVHPHRFFEMYIAEQQLVSASVGMQVLEARPVRLDVRRLLHARTTKIRMAAVSRARLCLVGARGRVDRRGRPGPDGARGPRDDARRLWQHRPLPVLRHDRGGADAADGGRDGIAYLRTTREKTPVLYGPGERFPIGGSKVLRRSGSDVAAILAAGITLHEALRAHDLLQERGIAVRCSTSLVVSTRRRSRRARAMPGGSSSSEDHSAAGRPARPPV